MTLPYTEFRNEDEKYAYEMAFEEDLEKVKEGLPEYILSKIEDEYEEALRDALYWELLK